MENGFQKIINGMKQELEMAHMEVAELNGRLTTTCEEKEALNSKYLAAFSKIEEDKVNMGLKSEVEALRIRISQLLVENVELNNQLAIAGKMEADLLVQHEEKDLKNSGYAIQIQTLKEKVDSMTLEQKRLREDKENSVMQIRNLEVEMNEASAQIMALTAQLDNLQKDLLSLQKEKEELVLHCERVEEAHAESLLMLENERNELAGKTLDHKRTLEEREDAYRKLNEEYKQIDNWFLECKVKLEVAEKKVQEMKQMVAYLEQTAEDLKRDVEDKGDEIDTLLETVRMLEVKLRLSNQKLGVAEKLLREQEENFRKTEEKFHKGQRSLEDTVANLSGTIAAYDEAYQEIMTDIKESVNSVMTGLENLVWKFSDEALEKENLTATVVQLQKTSRELEKLMKEKDERILDLGEEKREAIRQLCLGIDDHRSRYDYLKDGISMTRRGQRAT